MYTFEIYSIYDLEIHFEMLFLFSMFKSDKFSKFTVFNLLF